MGYYAEYSGTIQIKETPPDEIMQGLYDTFESVNLYTSKTTGQTELDISGYTKYYDGEVYHALDLLKPLVIDGEIAYVGEDGTHWRFKMDEEGWFEDDGEIVYASDLPLSNKEKQSDFIGLIIDKMQDVLDHPKWPTISGEWYDEIAADLKDLMKQWKVFS